MTVVHIKTIDERRAWLEGRVAAARIEHERKTTAMREFIAARGVAVHEFWTMFRDQYGPALDAEYAARYEDRCINALKEHTRTVNLVQESAVQLEAQVRLLQRQLDEARQANTSLRAKLKLRKPAQRKESGLVIDRQPAEEIERLARNITAWLERSTTPRVRKTEIREALGLEREKLGPVWSHLELSGQITATASHVELRGRT
jgi:hypothetical protein